MRRRGHNAEGHLGEASERPATSLVRLLSLALLILSATACYRGYGRRKKPFAAPGTGEGEETIHVRVENQNFSDATIHALRGGERVRLGQVTGKSESNFTVRWNFSLPLEFEIDMVGGPGCRVRPISVDPGDKIWVRIPTRCTMSPCYASKG